MLTCLFLVNPRQGDVGSEWLYSCASHYVPFRETKPLVCPSDDCFHQMDYIDYSDYPFPPGDNVYIYCLQIRPSASTNDTDAIRCNLVTLESLNEAKGETPFQNRKHHPKDNSTFLKDVVPQTEGDISKASTIVLIGDLWAEVASCIAMQRQRACCIVERTFYKSPCYINYQLRLSKS